MKNKHLIIILSALLIFCIVANFVTNIINKKNLYPLTTVVVAVSPANDTVTVKDFNGNLWQFKGTEDWEVDTIASCIMDSKGTPLIKDDEIIKVHYNGWFQGWE